MLDGLIVAYTCLFVSKNAAYVNKCPRMRRGRGRAGRSQFDRKARRDGPYRRRTPCDPDKPALACATRVQAAWDNYAALSAEYGRCRDRESAEEDGKDADETVDAKNRQNVNK